MEVFPSPEPIIWRVRCLIVELTQPLPVLVSLVEKSVIGGLLGLTHENLILVF